jgi:hypothetical protein
MQAFMRTGDNYNRTVQETKFFFRLTDNGDKYYRDVYHNALWKKADLISRPVVMITAIATIVWNFYIGKTTSQSSIELKQSIDSLKTNLYLMGLKYEEKFAIQEHRMKEESNLALISKKDTSTK